MPSEGDAPDLVFRLGRWSKRVSIKDLRHAHKRAVMDQLASSSWLQAVVALHGDLELVRALPKNPNTVITGARAVSGWFPDPDGLDGSLTLACLNRRQEIDFQAYFLRHAPDCIKPMLAEEDRGCRIYSLGTGEAVDMLPPGHDIREGLPSLVDVQLERTAVPFLAEINLLGVAAMLSDAEKFNETWKRVNVRAKEVDRSIFFVGLCRMIELLSVPVKILGRVMKRMLQESFDGLVRSMFVVDPGMTAAMLQTSHQRQKWDLILPMQTLSSAKIPYTRAVKCLTMGDINGDAIKAGKSIISAEAKRDWCAVLALQGDGMEPMDVEEEAAPKHYVQYALASTKVCVAHSWGLNQVPGKSDKTVIVVRERNRPAAREVCKLPLLGGNEVVMTRIADYQMDLDRLYLLMRVVIYLTWRQRTILLYQDDADAVALMMNEVIRDVRQTLQPPKDYVGDYEKHLDEVEETICKAVGDSDLPWLYAYVNFPRLFRFAPVENMGRTITSLIIPKTLRKNVDNKKKDDARSIYLDDLQGQELSEITDQAKMAALIGEPLPKPLRALTIVSKSGNAIIVGPAVLACSWRHTEGKPVELMIHAQPLSQEEEAPTCCIVFEYAGLILSYRDNKGIWTREVLEFSTKEWWEPKVGVKHKKDAEEDDAEEEDDEAAGGGRRRRRKKKGKGKRRGGGGDDEGEVVSTESIGGCLNKDFGHLMGRPKTTDQTVFFDASKVSFLMVSQKPVPSEVWKRAKVELVVLAHPVLANAELLMKDLSFEVRSEEGLG